MKGGRRRSKGLRREHRHDSRIFPKKCHKKMKKKGEGYEGRSLDRWGGGKKKKSEDDSGRAADKVVSIGMGGRSPAGGQDWGGKPSTRPSSRGPFFFSPISLARRFRASSAVRILAARSGWIQCGWSGAVWRWPVASKTMHTSFTRCSWVNTSRIRGLSDLGPTRARPGTKG